MPPVVDSGHADRAEDVEVDMREKLKAAHGTKVCIGHGHIKFHEAPEDFYVICSKHGQLCRLTRTRRAHESRPSQGRPLGLLAAWLMADHGSKVDHQLPESKMVAYGERVRARRELETVPGAHVLLNIERLPSAGELDGEPLGLP